MGVPGLGMVVVVRWAGMVVKIYVVWTLESYLDSARLAADVAPPRAV